MRWGGYALSFFGAILVYAAIHEFGHYLAGRSAGFRLHTVSVGPIQLTLRDGKSAWTFLRRPLLGGFIVMMPDDVADLERRTTKFLAGGCIASVLTTAALAGTAFAFGSGILPASNETVAGASFRYLTYFSLLMLYGTLIPFSTKTGYVTDMGLILKIRRGGREARAYMALNLVSREAYAGVPPRDWSQVHLDVALADAETPNMRSRALFLAATRAWDLSDLDSAEQWLEQALTLVDALPKQHLVRNLILMSAATFFAYHRRDTSRAISLRDQVFRGLEVIGGSEAMMDGAVALACGDAESALAACDRADKLFAKSARQGLNVSSESALLNGIRDQARRFSLGRLGGDSTGETFPPQSEPTHR